MVSIPGAGGRGAVPARGENRAPPPGTHFVTNNDCQIKCKLLQLSRLFHETADAAGIRKHVSLHSLRHNSEYPIIPSHRPIVA